MFFDIHPRKNILRNLYHLFSIAPKQKNPIQKIMNNYQELLEELYKICISITEATYESGVKQGYQLLVKLHNLGIDKDRVYQSLLSYYNSLVSDLSRNCLADIMDFIVGWCSPQNCIW